MLNDVLNLELDPHRPTWQVLIHSIFLFYFIFYFYFYFLLARHLQVRLRKILF